MFAMRMGIKNKKAREDYGKQGSENSFVGFELLFFQRVWGSTSAATDFAFWPN